MNKSFVIIPIMVALLVAGVFIAGCSGSDSTPGSSNQSAGVAVTTAAVSSGALYSAGDIVKNPSSNSNSALLIISYDAASDKYERAYIYPNSDGTWGYRMDSKTEMISRSTIDKVYTKKVGNKAVSAVPISTPTAAVIPTDVYTTATTTLASVTETTTTSSSLSPKMMSIEPDKGKTGETVSITDLVGINLQSGATITLVKSGNTNISATNVNVKSANLITCTFVIPSNSTTGYWDVVVRNPDGQYHQFQNGFNIVQGTATTTTTTTTTTSTNAPTITSINPSSVTGANRYALTIYGSNFRSGITAKLTKNSVNIVSVSDCLIETGLTQMKCSFDIPEASSGSWDLVVTNTDGTTVTQSSALTVNS